MDCSYQFLRAATETDYSFVQFTYIPLGAPVTTSTADSVYIVGESSSSTAQFAAWAPSSVVADATCLDAGWTNSAWSPSVANPMGGRRVALMSGQPTVTFTPTGGIPHPFMLSVK